MYQIFRIYNTDGASVIRNNFPLKKISFARKRVVDSSPIKKDEFLLQQNRNSKILGSSQWIQRPHVSYLQGPNFPPKRILGSCIRRGASIPIAVFFLQHSQSVSTFHRINSIISIVPYPSILMIISTQRDSVMAMTSSSQKHSFNNSIFHTPLGKIKALILVS